VNFHGPEYLNNLSTNNPGVVLYLNYFVENGYWGNRFAGKIASLMIEKYIKGTISRTDLEHWILTHSLEVSVVGGL